LMLRNLQK